MRCTTQGKSTENRYEYSFIQITPKPPRAAQRTIKARKIGTNIRFYLNFKWLQKPSKDGGFRRVKFFDIM